MKAILPIGRTPDGRLICRVFKGNPPQSYKPSGVTLKKNPAVLAVLNPVKRRKKKNPLPVLAVLNPKRKRKKVRSPYAVCTAAGVKPHTEKFRRCVEDVSGKNPRSKAADIAKSFHGGIRKKVRINMPKLKKTAYEVGKLEAVIYRPPRWSKIGPESRIHYFERPFPRLIGWTGKSPWMILGGKAKFTDRGFEG